MTRTITRMAVFVAALAGLVGAVAAAGPRPIAVARDANQDAKGDGKEGRDDASPPVRELPGDRLVDVFRKGDDGYHTYRIPAVVTTAKGTLLAFCEGRKSGRGDAGNIDLVLKRSTDGGRTWGPLQVLWDDGDNTCGNPAPVVDRDTGRIWLPLTWNLGTDHERDIMAGTSRFPRRVYMSWSDDDGATWQKPYEISDAVRRPHWRWYATGPGTSIQLTRGTHRGRLVVPANHSDHGDDRHPYRSHVFYSDDHGASWKLGGVVGEKTNESTIVELEDGSILDNMRSYHGKNRRALSVSQDGGESWSPGALHETLIEPVCQGHMLRHGFATAARRGRIVFANPASKSRERLTLRVSYDDGATWPTSALVYGGSAAYSCLTPLPPLADDGGTDSGAANDIGVLFERDGYARISFARVALEWIEGGEK